MDTLNELQASVEKFDLAFEDFGIAVRKVAGRDIQDIPMPDFHRTFDDYIGVLESNQITPVIDPESAEAEEIMTARRRYQTLVERLVELQSDRIERFKKLGEIPTSSDLAELQTISLEIDQTGTQRDQALEMVKDLQSTMKPAASFAVLEDSYSELQSAWKSVESFQDDASIEIESAQRDEETRMEENSSVLDSLILGDPLGDFGE